MMKQHPAVKRNVLCSLEQETQCTRKKTSVQSTEVAVRSFLTIQMTASEAHKVKGSFYHHSYSYRWAYNQWSS